mmetsp:Transcript_1561/g.4260  ORF Transcript_1561/g.4260 Transcript_1561/m.4260 type:complete len:149 (-) Transcript_1561:308-754(-)|eukprot:CAMPEP_0198131028 /NCGR_PEP_ID=MMETSP1442-20131203/55200_1 /TAXON_ID= /ORGANISM="Craspedostauros australis, Strain CCMP3328" /LENGTH=148 /DNA_ID=CAMNT_0043791755 /DNA_START=108 /DNA_END=554 /DNA_ORIENTATION=+
MFTTNEEDQRKVAELNARLKESNDSSTSAATTRIPNVTIDDGAHKYVLIRATNASTATQEHFVVSKRGAAYHRNAAEPMVERLQQNGYTSIDVTGGGRIYLDDDNRSISIFGYSYGFGQANHELSKSVIEKSSTKYATYDITTSNEGY